MAISNVQVTGSARVPTAGTPGEQMLAIATGLHDAITGAEVELGAGFSVSAIDIDIEPTARGWNGGALAALANLSIELQPK